MIFSDWVGSIKLGGILEVGEKSDRYPIVSEKVATEGSRF